MADYYEKSIFIFRRDLRLDDNSGLNAALSASKQVLACFIFDSAQIEPHPYQSKPGLQFMLQALIDLQLSFQRLGSKLALFQGTPESVLQSLILDYGIEAVFVNRDYTPFSRYRDAALQQLCRSLKIDFKVSADYLLNEPEQALKSDHTPYKVFTAFYNNARQIPVAAPKACVAGAFLSISPSMSIEQLPAYNALTTTGTLIGGRAQALQLLQQLPACADYTAERDFPALKATSNLSAHLKFGTCSVREAYAAITQALGAEHPLIRQLYWRDFFTHIAFHFPEVFGRSFLSKFAQLPWDNNLDKFKLWAAGKTGFPIVDAGMRELNATGMMHNRVRMIVAAFLVKDLQISWRWGERYFAQHLVDYDPCVNNGNWQWAASTGCDAQPYFRIFNPWLQQKKFDPECAYIYKWIPELNDVPVAIIQQWDKKHFVGAYPAPMLEHAQAAALTLARYKQAALNNA